ncbi:unnamed protein product [Cladocopium goreaui]|uniref:Uncharacterized protein n=1 Tax=Cladocopium goreaui TaxID=2562237 RepID=A0A9P1FHW3_9DINO|nr:unnamed protein product [Cladocopium goreaui]
MFAAPGPHILRPWMLPHRLDFGLRGSCDEVQKCLLQLMCLNGCLTSPDVPGGEKLVVTACEDRWLTSIKVQVACADFNANGLLLPPQHVFTVKGFNRATCALLLMLACSEFPPLMEALPKTVVESLSAIYVTKQNADLADVITTNRGVTLASSIRRRPNAFNLLHQMEVMLRGGYSGDIAIQNMEVMDSAAALASAYQVGRAEAGAATNLLKEVSASTRKQLKDLVRIFGQPRFILHDGLAAGIMNMDYVGTGNSYHAWDRHLSNSQEVVDLMLTRMRKDFESLAPKMRFLHRHADSDLFNLLQSSVPPCDLSRIDVFKNHVGKFRQKVEEDKVAKAAELEAALLQTTWAQTELSVANDLSELKSWADKWKVFAAQQGGLDMHYLNNRFETGKEKVKNYMEKHHSFTCYKTLTLAQGDIVEKQAALGKSAFSEWSMACANLQLKKLVDNASGPCFHYMGLFLNDDSQMMSKSSGTITGLLMSKWWDQAPDAGPKRRPQAAFGETMPNLESLTVANGVVKILKGCFRIPDLIKNKYQNSHANGLKALEDLISSAKDVAVAVKGSIGESQAAADTSNDTSGSRESVCRTLATPDFEGDVTPNFDRRIDLETKTMEEFNAERALRCSAKLANSELVVGEDTNENIMWLLNDSDSNQELCARELFGFNTGSFAEVVTGDASTVTDQIPWLVRSDLETVCLVMPDKKQLMTISDVMAWVTRTRGVTQVERAFRYTIIPKNKINCFRPKAMEGDMVGVRASQMGGCFNDFTALPKGDNFSIVWEVKVTDGVPALISPVKPKYYIKSVTTLPAKTAMKVQ